MAGGIGIVNYRYWVPENTTNSDFVDSNIGEITQVNNSSGFNNLINNVLTSGGPGTNVIVSRYSNLASSITYTDDNTENFSNDFANVSTFFVKVEDA